MTFGSDGVFSDFRGLSTASDTGRLLSMGAAAETRNVSLPSLLLLPCLAIDTSLHLVPLFACLPTQEWSFQGGSILPPLPHWYSLLCSSIPQGGCGHPGSRQNCLPSWDVDKVCVCVCMLTLQPDRCLSELSIRVTAARLAVCWTPLVRQGKSDEIHLLVQSLTWWAVPGMPVLYPTPLWGLFHSPGTSELQQWVP